MAFPVVNNEVDLSGPDAASQIGFIQAGAGAVPRTIEGKLNESVSVLDFGASGNDPSVNDTAAIELALATGKDVCIPSGYTFYVSSLTGFKDRQRIFGGGCFKRFVNGSGSAIGLILLPDGIDGLTFEDIEFDGNPGSPPYGQSASAILGYRTRSLNVLNCYFHDFVDVGIKLRDGARLYASGNRFINTMENGIEIHHYDRDVRTGQAYAWRPELQGNHVIIGNEFKRITRLEDENLVDACAVALLANTTTPAWKTGTGYVVGQMVSYRGVSYAAKVAHSNQAPPNTAYWSVVGAPQRIRNVRLIGNHVEDCLRGFVHESNELNLEGRHIIISGNTFENGVSGGPAQNIYGKVAILVNAVQGGVVSGNTIRNPGNHELSDPNALTTAGIIVTASAGITSCEQIDVVNNQIFDDTGDPQRTEYGVYVTAGTDVRIVGNRGSGMRSGLIGFNSNTTVAQNIVAYGNSGADDDRDWEQVIAVQFWRNNLPADGVGNFYPGGQSNQDEIILPCAGRVVGVSVIASAPVAPGLITINVTGAAANQSGLSITEADFGEGRQASKKRPANTAEHLAPGQRVGVQFQTQGFSTTNQLHVTLLVDVGRKR
jgi:putative cofactor-binding repeat protein